MRNMEQAKYEFTTQGKLDPSQTQRLLNVEVAFKDLAGIVLEMVPETQTRTIALDHLLMAKMLCSQSISHPGVKAAPAAPAPVEPNNKEITNANQKAPSKKSK